MTAPSTVVPLEFQHPLETSGTRIRVSTSNTTGRLLFVSALACSSVMSGSNAPIQDQALPHILDLARLTSDVGSSWIIPPSTSERFGGSWTFAKPNLPEVVTRLHELSGLTWDQLAKLFGVSRRAVHHWASGGTMSVRNVELLQHLAREIGELPGKDPRDRRSALLAPEQDGYSLYDKLRRRYATSTLDVSGTPFTPEQMLGVLHD